MNEEILKVVSVSKFYPIYSSFLKIKISDKRILNNISFSLQKNISLGILGASGVGKSTLAKIIAKVEKPDSGEIFVEGKNIKEYSRKEFATKVQLLFQNPYSMINPKLQIEFLLKERIKQYFILNNKDFDNQSIYSKIEEFLYTAKLSKNVLKMYSYQLSGGQRQRVALLLVLSLYPKIIILDEPLSALDISLQAQMLNFFIELKEKFHFSYIFITHDKNVAEYFCDKILVLHEDGGYEML
jgi:ABC-type dipeptide/oligopeptide/nickel transport system ATPase subunit